MDAFMIQKATKTLWLNNVLKVKCVMHSFIV